MPKPLEQYKAAFDAGRERATPSWLARTREDALARFLSLGFPTTRDEEWRFTSVAPIADQVFAPGSGPLPDAELLAAYRPGIPSAAELVFVDGRHVPALSSTGGLPRGVRVEPLARQLTTAAEGIEPFLARIALFENRAFTALNTALSTDGASIHVPAHAVVDGPIHVLFWSTGGADGWTMAQPRVLVVAGENSQASIVETHAGPDGARYFSNGVAEVVLGAHAVLHHYKLQRDSVRAYHIGSTHVRAARSATFASHSISLGGAIVRNDVVAVLDGEGVECTLNGLYLADEQRLVDNHTTVDHAKPHCGSREMYKGILADRARGVFNGKIIVRPDAQKTDAKQTNRALLLSEDARINTKPQLEIFANDVKCTHGAAVGQLDEEAVFYLRSRGLGEAAARRLLIHAFASDVLNRLPLEPVRKGVEALLARQLARALPVAA